MKARGLERCRPARLTRRVVDLRPRAQRESLPVKKGRGKNSDHDRLFRLRQEAERPVIKRWFVNAVRLERDRVPSFEEYPFCIPSIRNLERLELHPAMENGALEAEPSAASHRAVALASPWICQTTSVAPVELVAPLNIRLPADPVKAPIAVVILEVPSAAKDCAISWPSPCSSTVRSTSWVAGRIRKCRC